MTGKNEKNLTETVFLFHFPSQLKLYFFKSGKIKNFNRILNRRNIVSFLKRTFFWEDKGRYIERMESVIQKDEKHYFYKAYDAKNVIKICKKIDYLPNKECLLVCDEDKFIKILSYDEGNKKFDVEKEYYVNDSFGIYEDVPTLDTYYLTQGMLYKNNETILLQERGHEQVQNTVYIDEPAAFRYNTHQFPLVSNSHIIKAMEDYTYTGKNELYICSPYNSNKVPNVNDYGLGLEWFSPDQKDKIIRVKLHDNFQLGVSLNNSNGDTLQTSYIYYYSYPLEILPSQDGRYILIYSQEGDDDDYDPVVNWKVYEIKIKTATQTDPVKKNTEKVEFDNIRSEETKEGSTSAKKKDIFEVVEINDGTIKGDFGGVLFEKIKMGVLNTGNMIAVHMESRIFMFDKENYYERIAKDVYNNAKDLQKNRKTDGFIVDQVKLGQNYVLMRFPKFLYSFRFGIDPMKPDFAYSFKRLRAPLITEYKGINLDDIIITSHPNKILLKYSFEEVQQTEKHNILIWDIEKDEEISSFTSRENDKFLFYIYSPIEEVNECIMHHASKADKYSKNTKLLKQMKKEAEEKDRKQAYLEGEEHDGGENEGEEGKEEKEEKDEDEDKYRISQTGYLVFDQYYVNLDSMVPSPFMQFKGEELIRDHYQFGPKMNCDESLAIVGGTAISAFSYLDIEFRSKRQVYHGNPSI